MNSSPLKTSLNRDTLTNIIAAFLHAGRLVPDSENIIDIQIGDFTQDLIPLTITYKNQQVIVINH